MLSVRRMSLRLSSLACLFVVLPLACTSSVVTDEGAGGSGGSGDEDECGPQPVGIGGYCPPSYVCIDGEWVDTAGACPDPCPESAPTHGTPCDAVGVSCPYEEEELGCGPVGTVTATCTSEGWEVTTPYCLPEPECPEALPLDGASCEGWEYAYFCSYGVEASCGPVTANAFCEYVGDEMIWSAQLTDECPTCDELTTAETCGAHPDCAWYAETEVCEPLVD